MASDSEGMYWEPSQNQSIASNSICVQSDFAIHMAKFSDVHADENWVTNWIREVDTALECDGVPEPQEPPAVDWDCTLSNVMDQLVNCFQNPCIYRKMMGTLRCVSKAWNSAASSCVNSIDAHETTASIVASALHSTFTRATTLVMQGCPDGVNSEFGRVLRKLNRIQSLEILPITLGWTIHHQRQVEAIGSIESLTRLKLWGPVGMTGDGLRRLSKLANLEELSLGSRLQVHGGDLSSLQPLTSLTSLELEGCVTLGNVGLRYIGKLVNLRDVSIGVHKGLAAITQSISYKGLLCMGALPKLKSLQLSGCESVQDRDVEGLWRSPQLETLRLQRLSELTDEGISSLSRIASLTSLSLLKCPNVSDESVAGLACLPRLRVLRLGDCWRVSDAVVGHLASMASLRDLTLSRCALMTDTGLAALADIHHIRTFKLEGVGGEISAEGVYLLSLNSSVCIDWKAWECYVVKVEMGGESDTKS
ncbi:hypothetical protein BSKO_08197 [Bryopsis sp. KO-2023]|nr:hypothetical protein BSKO_08197 [Bryopsis sp. KO-2023]